MTRDRDTENTDDEEEMPATDFPPWNEQDVPERSGFYPVSPFTCPDVTM
jgi:hypothetical protein